MARDSKRIWEAAEFFNAHTYATKKRAPPSDEDQREVNRFSIAALVTRAAHNADMTKQAWEQRAMRMLPQRPHKYLAQLQHNITEQFPARYTLREGETWEANARYARHLRSLEPLLKSSAAFALLPGG